MKSYKEHFSRFLGAAPDRLHFASHSHHFWPDVTFEAHRQCWLDSARYADDKWSHIFSELVPAVQAHIARTLNLSQPDNIAFATNTHEFVLRLLSCLRDKPEILTTDAEFHSLKRQIWRLEQEGLVHVKVVPAEPFETFPERFIEAAGKRHYDMVFFSHVFFNSGYAVLEPEKIVRAVPSRDTFIVIDAYHGYMALPTDLSAIEDRAFYIAGGYKYAMAGSGCCFMHCPPDYGPHPRNTGWYAAFGTLEQFQPCTVPYSKDGWRFMGATFDPSGLYRMKAVMDWLEKEGLSVQDIHDHVLALQKRFLDKTDQTDSTLVTPVDTDRRGHFLTYETEQAPAMHAALRDRNIMTDYRDLRLRFGFGLYHDMDDVEKLVAGLLECDFIKTA